MIPAWRNKIAELITKDDMMFIFAGLSFLDDNRPVQRSYTTLTSNKVVYFLNSNEGLGETTGARALIKALL